MAEASTQPEISKSSTPEAEDSPVGAGAQSEESTPSEELKSIEVMCEEQLLEFHDIEEEKRERVRSAVSQHLNDDWLQLPSRDNFTPISDTSSTSDITERGLEDSENEWRHTMKATLEFCSHSLATSPAADQLTVAKSFVQRTMRSNPADASSPAETRRTNPNERFKIFVVLTTLKEYAIEKYKKMFRKEEKETPGDHKPDQAK